MKNFPFNLDQLIIFKTIVRFGSFNQAAKSLYLSQPAVSRQIQNLEQQLNIVLFDRDKKKKRIYLTEGGRLLLNYTNRILPLCEQTYKAMNNFQEFEINQLILGGSQTTGTYILPRTIGLFRQKYPNIKVKLAVHSTRRIAWSIVNGQVDIGIVGGEIPRELLPILQITPYAEDELVLISSNLHPLSKFDSIQKEDLYRLKFLTLNHKSTTRRVMDKILDKNNIDSQRLKIEMELNSIEAIKNGVQAGLGVAFVSISSIGKELELKSLKLIKIDQLDIKRTLVILTNPNNFGSNIIQSFCNNILTVFLTLPKSEL